MKLLKTYCNNANIWLKTKWPLSYQLTKEAGLPFVAALGWTYWSLPADILSKGILDIGKEGLKTFAPSFFFISWLPAQFNRIKKQSSVEGGLKAILKELDEKTKNLIGHVTGGDSTCFLSAAHMGDGTIGYLSVCQYGTYPMYEINTRIVDLRHHQLLVQQHNANIPVNWFAADTNLSEISCLTKQMASTFTERLICDHEDYAAYTIFFSARNGNFVQKLIFRRVEGIWQRAIRVTRHGTDDCVFMNVYDEFPRGPDGEVNWELPPLNQ